VAIASTRGEGNHLARLYVHLYRNEEIDIIDDHGSTQMRQRRDTYNRSVEQKSNRVALNFLDAPALPIRFTYAPTGHNWGAANTPRDAVPSQLPNRSAPQ